MKEEILDIAKKLYHNHLTPELATDLLLRLFDVSGMFSSEKLEQAYKEGVRDALAKGYGTFDEENDR